jgi:ATP-dependent DNA ligase
MRLNQTYPELMSINKQIKKRCILDGELLVMKEGKPDFYDLQKRSLMTNKTKIEFAMKRIPVSFIAYDILYLDNLQIIDKPLMERKNILQKTITENEHISVSRFIPDLGVKFYKLTVEQGLEGIVAKQKDSKYFFDKRTKEWLKIKIFRMKTL